MIVPLLLFAVVAGDTVLERFPAPAGTARVDVVAGSFGAYLRALPLKPAGTPVLAFDGRTIDAPWAKAVVDVDVGSKDLQQCADSAIRLYAEHRRAQNDVDGLSFHATSGDPLPWKRYAAGERPSAPKNKVIWSKKAAPSSSAATFRSWLDAVFLWAGSRSLALDTVAVDTLAPGDLLVVGGSPGHVLVVLDVATATAGGKPQLLIGQGYMPAQSFHVIGWTGVDDDGSVTVPSWPAPFPREGHRRFRSTSRPPRP
ncbi:MAG: DUF4846 domain-containing protein [Deltaproteobacteria bacterium]|nr:DUF4846 domain-containing protein [Deltaproteobacteria bacterium]